MMEAAALRQASVMRAGPWGKTGSGMSHHLAHHCADVSACFEALIATPVIRARLERAAETPLDDVVLSRLAVLCFIHDIGKVHPGFQAKGWPPGHGVSLHGHVGEGLAVFHRAELGPIRDAIAWRQMCAWTERDAFSGLVAATFAHHGRPAFAEAAHAQGWSDGVRYGYDPQRQARAIGELLPGWFPKAYSDRGQPLPSAERLHHLFCGLVALADWIGSNRDVFSFVAELDVRYMDIARAKAQQAIKAMGVDTAAWRAYLPEQPSFSAIAPGRTPRAAQAAIGDCPLDQPLVILEAETGSGKTEAALWRFARLFQAGQVDGLYFAVPTGAAAKQLHERVTRSMASLFGEGAPEAVLAIPGYLRIGDHAGQALPEFQVLWEDHPSDEKRLSRWAAESARRFLAAPVAVGTIDQAMLASLQVKHAHLRCAALSRSLLVIDEVHASDPYMTAVQAGLLDTHLAFGGHAMLMSATLGSEAREKWLRGRRASVPACDDAIATPYPALWTRKGSGPVAADSRSKAVHIRLSAGWGGHDAAREAVTMARAGARVLVIRNTVAAAHATFEAVQDMGAAALLWQVAGGPALHHSRFAPEDRALLDEAVELALSKDQQKRPAGGVIVIGTQTLEQSLDICADVLITDLCPADVLLQRIGRLHRHDLIRPVGFEQPACVVLAPENGLDRLAAPAFDNGIGAFRDGGGIYRNLHACELTHRLIAAHPVWRIPFMNRFLVESATHPEQIEALSVEKGKAWSSYRDAAYGKDLADAQSGRGMRLPVDEPFECLKFPEDDQRVRTRLGAEGAIIPLAGDTVGPFGGVISSLACPAHWRITPPDKPMEAVRNEDGGLMVEVSGQRIEYRRRGLSRRR